MFIVFVSLYEIGIGWVWVCIGLLVSSKVKLGCFWNHVFQVQLSRVCSTVHVSFVLLDKTACPLMFKVGYTCILHYHVSLLFVLEVMFSLKSTMPQQQVVDRL